MTVVDYADAEKIHTARVEQCRKNGGEGDACQNDWRSDVQGSMVFAASKYVKRNAKVTYFGWAVVDHVEGMRVQLTNADGSRTFAEIHRHGTRLYILEATVPRESAGTRAVSAVAACSSMRKAGRFAIDRSTRRDTRKDGNSRRPRRRARARRLRPSRRSSR